MPKGIYNRKKSKPRPKHTELRKEKMRQIMKGNRYGRGNLGRKNTKTWKLGPMPESQKQKIREIKTGTKASKETRLKLSKQRTGEGNSNYKHGRSTKTYKFEISGREKPERCDICKVYGKDFKKGLCFDHNHKTGKFRGWICTKCNIALGMVDDDIKKLENLINYLKRTK